jgi:hypothetical protein
LAALFLVDLLPVCATWVKTVFLALALIYLFTHIIQLQVYYFLPACLLILAVAQACLLLFHPRARPARERPLVLIAFGLAAGLLSFVGSSMGIQGSYASLWLLLPIALMLPLTLGRLWPDPAHGWLSGRSLDLGLAAVIAATLVTSLTIGYFDHKDRQAAGMRKGVFLEHPRFRGITAPRETARSLDELFAKLDELTSPTDRTLAYLDIPMVYYASRTVPSLGEPWADRWSASSLQSQLNQLEASGQVPKVIVRAKAEDGQPTKPLFENVVLLDAWAAGQGFSTAWSNHRFVILTRERP